MLIYLNIKLWNFSFSLIIEILLFGRQGIKNKITSELDWIRKSMTQCTWNFESQTFGVRDWGQTAQAVVCGQVSKTMMGTVDKGLQLGSGPRPQNRVCYNDGHVLTSVLGLYCCFLITKYLLVNINVEHSFSKLVLPQLLQFNFPNTSIKGRSSKPSGYASLLREGSLLWLQCFHNLYLVCLISCSLL